MTRVACKKYFSGQKFFNKIPPRLDLFDCSSHFRLFWKEGKTREVSFLDGFFFEMSCLKKKKEFAPTRENEGFKIFVLGERGRKINLAICGKAKDGS